jgi:hypothetical protein
MTIAKRRTERTSKRGRVGTLVVAAALTLVISGVPSVASQAAEGDPGDIGINHLECARDVGDQFVEIRNFGEPFRPNDLLVFPEVDMSGWTITNRDGTVYTFPDGFTLMATTGVTVWAGEGTDTAGELFMGLTVPPWFHPDDGDDAAFLFDGDGNFVDGLNCLGEREGPPEPPLRPEPLAPPVDELGVCVDNTMVEPLTNATNRVSWDPVPNAAEYHVHEVVNGEVGGIIALLDGNTTVFHHENLEVGETYHYAVAADGHPHEECAVVSATAIPFFPGLAGAVAAALGALGVALVVARRSK